MGNEKCTSELGDEHSQLSSCIHKQNENKSTHKTHITYYIIQTIIMIITLITCLLVNNMCLLVNNMFISHVPRLSDN